MKYTNVVTTPTPTATCFNSFDLWHVLILDQISISMMFPPTYLPDFHDTESVQKLKYRQIGKTDILASSLSFGASSLGGVFRTTDDAESGCLNYFLVWISKYFCQCQSVLFKRLSRRGSTILIQLHGMAREGQRKFLVKLSSKH